MNITSYVSKTKSDFYVLPFNEADSLVLCQLVYLAFGRKFSSEPKLTLADLAESASELVCDTFFPKENVKLIKAVAASPRFAPIKIGYFRYRNSTSRVLRFAAVTFVLPDDTAYVVYRGTDVTILGWKEDFYMSFLDAIPSHGLAQKYLLFVAERRSGKLLVGGHSKGGNLAVYAAVHADGETRRRIEAVYNHDGPGFRDSIRDKTDYAEMSGKIIKTVPRDSLVGMLLNTDTEFQAVDSNSILLMQHNPFNWVIKRDGTFKKVSQTSYVSRVTDITLTQWIYGMDRTQRKELVAAIFTVLEGCGADKVTDIPKNLLSAMRGMNKAYKQLDQTGKELMRLGGKELLKLWFGTVFLRRSKSKGSRI